MQHMSWRMDVKPVPGKGFLLTLWCGGCGDSIEELYESKREATAGGAIGLEVFDAAHSCRQLRLT